MFIKNTVLFLKEKKKKTTQKKNIHQVYMFDDVSRIKQCLESNSKQSIQHSQLFDH